MKLIPLLPHPATLRKVVEEYTAAVPGPRARDLAYTLCVLTGTRDVRAALETAHRRLAAAGLPPEPAATLGGTLPTAAVMTPAPGAPATRTGRD